MRKWEAANLVTVTDTMSMIKTAEANTKRNTSEVAIPAWASRG